MGDGEFEPDTAVLPTFDRTQPAAMSSACRPSPSLSRVSDLASWTRSTTNSSCRGLESIGIFWLRVLGYPVLVCLCVLAVHRAASFL
jgi:hypothetical protein